MLAPAQGCLFDVLHKVAGVLLLHIAGAAAVVGLRNVVKAAYLFIRRDLYVSNERQRSDGYADRVKSVYSEGMIH
jgi:hypothetical protein